MHPMMLNRDLKSHDRGKGTKSLDVSVQTAYLKLRASCCFDWVHGSRTVIRAGALFAEQPRESSRRLVVRLPETCA